MPDDDPVKVAHLPIVEALDAALWAAWRCRIVNRAFGTSMTPDQVAATVPDETIDLLGAALAHDLIDDTGTLLRLSLAER